MSSEGSLFSFPQILSLHHMTRGSFLIQVIDNSKLSNEEVNKAVLDFKNRCDGVLIKLETENQKLE